MGGRFLLVLGVLGVILVGAAYVGVAATSNPVPSPTTTVTLTGGDYFGASGLTVQTVVAPTEAPPTGVAEFRFNVISDSRGTFSFAIAERGAVITPPHNMAIAPSFTLPSYVSASFPGGAVVNQGGNSTSVVVNISTNGAPSGPLSIELVIFQDQGSGIIAATTFPITFGVG
jgi:hypothetical protein